MIIKLPRLVAQGRKYTIFLANDLTRRERDEREKEREILTTLSRRKPCESRLAAFCERDERVFLTYAGKNYFYIALYFFYFFLSRISHLPFLPFRPLLPCGFYPFASPFASPFVPFADNTYFVISYLINNNKNNKLEEKEGSKRKTQPDSPPSIRFCCSGFVGTSLSSAARQHCRRLQY
jgi:hypothetical protein